MTETLDVTQLYVKNLENKISNLVKSTIVLETNVEYINAIVEQRNSQIEEMARKFGKEIIYQNL